jgi:hypothetical protein
LITGIRSFGCRGHRHERKQERLIGGFVPDKQRALGKPYRMGVISLRFAAILHISSPIGRSRKKRLGFTRSVKALRKQPTENVNYWVSAACK